MTEDIVCEHGTAIDVHCCNCHSGFLFDIDWCVCIFEERIVKNIVLYHGNCFDGMASAWAAWKKLGDDAQYIPVSYGQIFPIDKFESEIHIYIVDFSFKRDVLVNVESMLSSFEGKLVVIDHHKTAQKDLEGLDFCIFDMNKSGARLTWEYFIKQSPGSDDIDCWQENIPKLIQYVEDRDLWRFKLEYSQEINSFIQSYPMDIKNYELVSRYLEDNFDDCLAQGHGIERYKNTMVETQARARRFYNIGGYPVPVVNSSILFSEVGNFLCKEHPLAKFAAYYVDRNDGMRQWGLRSIGDFDVSEIAKKYNGGGHKNAAGFITAQSYYGDQ